MANTQSKSTGKGRRPSPKGSKIPVNMKGKDERFISKGEQKCREAVAGAINDVTWYAHNPQLLKDAASLAFSTVTGRTLNLGTPSGTSIGVTYKQDVGCVPGIMALRYAPSIGHVTGLPGANSAINIAANNIYSFVRHKNSGSSNYFAPDLMMTIMAASSAFSAIALGIRAYGIARTYDQKNRYVPEAMLTAMGFDAASIRDNLASFRYGLNNLIAKASVIWVPKNMPIVARQFWMNSNIYKDSDSTRAQFYIYVPQYLWKYDMTTSPMGTSLQPEAFSNLNMTYSAYLNKVDSMIAPLIADEEAGIMFGDMLKAYGKENLYSLDMIGEDYMVVPVHEKEVLNQIHNAVGYAVSNRPAVLQSALHDGYIYEEGLEIAYTNCGYTPKTLLDFDSVVPEPEDIMVGTRMTAHLPHYYNASTQKIEMTNILCGTERLLSQIVYWFDETGTLQSDTWHTFMSASFSANSEEQYARYSRFKDAPIIYWGDQAGTTTSPVFNLDAIMGDLDVYTLLDPTALSKMHSTAILSEYDVPVDL